MPAFSFPTTRIVQIIMGGDLQLRATAQNLSVILGRTDRLDPKTT